MIKIYKYINPDKENIDLKGKRVVIWGRAKSALNLYIELNEVANVIGFVDSNSQDGEKFAGLPVYSFQTVLNMENIYIYISTQTYKYRIEILELLQDISIPIICRGTVWGPGEYDTNVMRDKIKKDNNKIQKVLQLLQDEKSIRTFENLVAYRTQNDYRLIEEIYNDECTQYFPESSIFSPMDDEIFIDAGGYNGDTSIQFAEWTKGKYEKIYILEPDELMQEITRENIALMKLPRAEVIGKGAFSANTVLSFKSIADSGSSKIDDNGEESIQTITIDTLLHGTRASYIKMDIEGAELEALKGAGDTIREYRPKLAISIYHKDDDLWNIPYYIFENYPWYKLYIRQYGLTSNETVLYAVSEG